MAATSPSIPSAAPQPLVIPPPTAEEEDQIILTRITIDERPLRRIIKKFHLYSSLSHSPVVPFLSTPDKPSTVEDAREAFLLELASFQLLMKKAAMTCEAEARQVEEYHRERQRLDDEHVTLKTQIEELKIALEHAQMLRRRKMEYDLVAEKVNSLPSREELEMSIQTLENDMAAIRLEHEIQTRTILQQKSALDGIVTQLASVRHLGKEPETMSVPQSLRATPAPDAEMAPPESSATPAANTDDGNEEKRIQESIAETAPSEGLIEETDIEMGEVEEDHKEKNNKRKVREDLEEGEATDGSSELSEPPDD